MKKQQIYGKIRVRQNQRGAKRKGARKLEARKSQARNLKRVQILMGIRNVLDSTLSLTETSIILRLL